MECAKNVRWMIPFKKFSMVRVNNKGTSNYSQISKIQSFNLGAKDIYEGLVKRVIASMFKDNPFRKKL